MVKNFLKKKKKEFISNVAKKLACNCSCSCSSNNQATTTGTNARKGASG